MDSSVAEQLYYNNIFIWDLLGTIVMLFFLLFIIYGFIRLAKEEKKNE